MGKKQKSYSPSFKFQVVLESLKREKENIEVARGYGVHPVTVSSWKRIFLDKGAQIFGGDKVVKDYEQKIRQLEQLLGQKEVEIALLKNFLQKD